MDNKEKEIRVNLKIEKDTNDLFFDFIKKFPKRKRATIIRNAMEEYLRNKKIND